MDEDNIIPYEASPTLTVKQAVMYMLGYRGEYTYMVETDLMEFSLSDYLYDLQDEAGRVFDNASYELEMLKRDDSASPEEIKTAEKKVASAKADLEQANKLPELAEQYRLQINHEVSRARLGKRNSLVIDADESARAGQTCINMASFQDWFEEIELDDDTSDSVPVKLPLADEALDQAIEITSKSIESLFFTLGLLVSKFAESSDGELGSSQKPNVSGIANELAKYAKKRESGHKVRGQGHERIKDRIEVALSVLHTTT